MAFLVAQPSPALAPFIERIWDWDMPQAAHHLERVLPSPAPALIINLHENETRVYADDAERRCTLAPAAVLGGPCLRSQIIDTAEQVRVMGVVFRPAGAWAFSREDQQAFLQRDIGLEDIYGHVARQLRERLLHTPDSAERVRLLDRWLCDRLAVSAPDACVGHAIAALACAPQLTRVAALVRDSGMSEYRFGRLFSRQVGMGPKRFARLLRFRVVVEQVHADERVEWAHVAADNGYTDQSHLVREFREFAGMTPAAFVAARGQYVNHVPLDGE